MCLYFKDSPFKTVKNVLSSVVPQREEATRAEKAVSFVFPDTHRTPCTETHTVSHKETHCPPCTETHRETHWHIETHCPVANERLQYDFCLLTFVFPIWQNVFVDISKWPDTHVAHYWKTQHRIHIARETKLLNICCFIDISVSFMDSERKYML